MRRKVWIWNHYATNMFFDRAGRHYWFAENLEKQGYEPTIFCASTDHFSNIDIPIKEGKYLVKKANNIPFVFIKTPRYKGNGKKRIMNMISFYRELFLVSKEYAKTHGKPDIIIASSVHPLTLVAGIKIAKKFEVPCVCEIRDLWPESLVAYGSLEPNSIIAKLLYQGEKWIYKKADSIIMTWEGGSQYIKDKGWDTLIDLHKVHYISNGIVISDFDKNIQENPIKDTDLMDKRYKNIVYTGSIRKVNDLGIIVDVAKFIQKESLNIRFLIYGSGDEKEILEKRCQEEGIINIFFKGRVEKKKVPSILNESYINILHNSSTSLNKYGQSQNKFFEYLAAGRCIVQTYSTGYSILNKYHCGICVPKQSSEEIAKIILQLCRDENDIEEMGKNARKAAQEFDFEKLTNKLVQVIERE